MSDSFAIPVNREFGPRPNKVKAKVDGAQPTTPPSISPAGPRKLIRPTLPESARRYPPRLNGTSSGFFHHRLESTSGTGESTHAEAFYFQKQIQSRTPMIFLLEDGERIEGVIEWYDRHSIKIRQGGLRTLIYKAGIKYLYKATESERINGRL